MNYNDEAERYVQLFEVVMTALAKSIQNSTKLPNGDLLMPKAVHDELSKTIASETIAAVNDVLA